MPRTSRRESKPEPFWRDLIDRWRISGQSIAAFCAAQRMSKATHARNVARRPAARLLVKRRDSQRSGADDSAGRDYRNYAEAADPEDTPPRAGTRKSTQMVT